MACKFTHVPLFQGRWPLVECFCPNFANAQSPLLVPALSNSPGYSPAPVWSMMLSPWNAQLHHLYHPKAREYPFAPNRNKPKLRLMAARIAVMHITATACHSHLSSPKHTELSSVRLKWDKHSSVALSAISRMRPWAANNSEMSEKRLALNMGSCLKSS